MAVKRVFFFGGGKAEGNGAMKDVLGGKGAGLAEMTNLGVPVPPGFTISTEACNLLLQEPREASAGCQGGDRGEPREARACDRQEARRSEKPAARLRPFGGEVLHARHDGHGPQPRTERQDGGRACAEVPQPPVCVRFLPPLPDDVLRRGARPPQERLRAHLRREEAGARRRLRRRPDRRRPDGRVREVQGAGQGAN